MKNLFYTFFPKPRRPITATSWIPLIIFAAIFLAVYSIITFSSIMAFERPHMLWLILISFWFWWMYAAGHAGFKRVLEFKLSSSGITFFLIVYTIGAFFCAAIYGLIYLFFDFNPLILFTWVATIYIALTILAVVNHYCNGPTILIIRLLLLAAFVFVLAEPRAVRTSDKLAIVYALDMSDSIGEQVVNQALTFVSRTAVEKPTNDFVGLVVFGRNAAVELPPRITFPFADENLAINAKIDRDATNLEQGLTLAATMLPDEHIGRIVLISDGVRTEGQLQRVIDDLKAKGIAVDVVPIEYGHDNEVWVERLELPRNVKTGETYEASILLSALKPGKGTIVLKENGQEIARIDREFKAGKNRFELPLYLRTAGYYEYTAEVIVSDDQDGWKENNIAMNYLFLEGDGKTLVVTDPGGRTEDYTRLVQALRESNRNVEIMTAFELPRDSLSLLPYDSIIFVNTPADAIDAVQMKAVHDAVYDLGIGFLMVGGENSFGPGGYHHTPIEDALPITMDIKQRKVMPKGALAIILHTCEFAAGNNWAKRITKKAIKVLGANDEAGVLVFDWQGQDRWLFPLMPASEYNKMVPLINQSSPADMPSFVPTMRLGLVGLQNSDAATKHMIIISDGDPTPPSPAMLQKYVDSKITVSTIGINPHTPNDTKTLEMIASVTGGKYHFANDPSQLPSIFIKEAKTLRRSMIQNITFVPEIGSYSDIIKGISAMPPLRAFILSTPKERSNIILQTPPGKDESEPDPVLVTWRYGLGKTAAFSSDLSPRWAQDWMGWGQYQSFVQQLVTAISRVNKQQNLQLRTEVIGGIGLITVEDFSSDESFLDLAAVISGPRDKSETIKLKQVAPKRFQAEVPLWGKGRYQVTAQAIGPNREEKVHGGMILPYSPEYLRFKSNPKRLRQISDQTRGRIIDQPSSVTGEELFGVRRSPKRSSLPIFDYFLWALAILIPLDVAVRRVQIDWDLIRDSFRNVEATASTATMGTLLQTKKAVGQTLRGSQSDKKETSTIKQVVDGSGTGTTESTTNIQRNKDKAKPQSTDSPADYGTTTSRLLAEKRKRKEQEDES